MKNLEVVRVEGFVTALNVYKNMPKVANTPSGYTLKVNGTEMKAPEVATTGGGAFPSYTYLLLNGTPRWFAGVFASGTAVEVVDPTPKPVEAAPAPAEAPKPEAPAEAPKAPEVTPKKRK